MPEYNNTAGRILLVLERLSPLHGKNVKLAQFAEAIGVTANWATLLSAIQDLHDEFDSLCDEIEQVKDNAAKYSLYKANLSDIEKSVKSFTLQLSGDICNCNITQTGVVALRFIAADLPQDEAFGEGDLKAIREIVNELQSEIEGSDAFTKSVREWLLDLVRVIRDSIDRFQIRGSRGMRKQISLLLGELLQNYDVTKQVNEKKPKIWKRFTNAIDLMNKLASLAKHAQPAVTFAQKSLPFLKILGLPAPDEISINGE